MPESHEAKSATPLRSSIYILVYRDKINCYNVKELPERNIRNVHLMEKSLRHGVSYFWRLGVLINNRGGSRRMGGSPGELREELVT